MVTSKTQVQAPARSLDQRMEALRRANEIRVARAQLKRDLKAGVVTVELTLTGAKYKDGPAVIAGYRGLWERLRALPGVEAAGGVTSLPMSGFFAWGPITAEGRQPVAGEKFLNADMRSVGGDYFTAMRIPLVRGRVFDDRDWPVPGAAPPARWATTAWAAPRCTSRWSPA